MSYLVENSSELEVEVPDDINTEVEIVGYTLTVKKPPIYEAVSGGYLEIENTTIEYTF